VRGNCRKWLRVELHDLGELFVKCNYNDELKKSETART
jgi:hypothetical protein